MSAQYTYAEIEYREDGYILVCRNVSKMRGIVTLGIVGLYWLFNIRLWKNWTVDWLFLSSISITLFVAYAYLIDAFGKTTIEVSREKILLDKIQFPFPTKKIIETKDIEEIICETNWAGHYDVKAKLKSDKKIKLYETATRDNAQFLLTTLDFSVKNFQLNANDFNLKSLIGNRSE